MKHGHWRIISLPPGSASRPPMGTSRDSSFNAVSLPGAPFGSPPQALKKATLSSAMVSHYDVDLSIWWRNFALNAPISRKYWYNAKASCFCKPGNSYRLKPQPHTFWNSLGLFLVRPIRRRPGRKPSLSSRMHREKFVSPWGMDWLLPRHGSWTTYAYEVLRKIWIQELQSFQQDEIQADVCSLPTLTDLEKALRRVPRGCACGPDGLPGELCHHQLAAIARLLCPGLLKTARAVSFQGRSANSGLHYKRKGPVDSWRSFRSVLVSTHLGKAVHRSIRQHAHCLYLWVFSPSATNRWQTWHSCLTWGTSNQSLLPSCQAMWTETFYRAFREVPLGGNITDELLAHLMHKLRMPEDSLHDIHDLLQEKPAIELAGLDPLHQRCFRAIHLSTHFSMRNQHDASRTTMGTRSQNWHRLWVHVASCLDQIGASSCWDWSDPAARISSTTTNVWPHLSTRDFVLVCGSHVDGRLGHLHFFLECWTNNSHDGSGGKLSAGLVCI